MADTASMMTKNDVRSGRPSLYSVSSDAGAESPSSILSGLESKRQPRRIYIGLGIGVIALVAMVNLSGGRAWIASEPYAAKQTPAVIAESAQMPPQPDSNAAASQPMVAADSADIPQSALSQAATVEIERPITLESAQATPIAAEQPVGAQANALDAKTIQSPSPMTGKSGADGGLALAKSDTLHKATKRNTRTTNTRNTVSDTPKKREKVVTAKAPQRDQDVELIAALLARIAPEERRASGGKAKVAASKPGAAANNIAPAGRGRSSEFTRDVVFRSGTNSTEVLIERCLSLGFFEGELCRLRVCSGRWGSDPACPSAQQAMVGPP